MANTFKFGNGNWAVKDGYALAYNDENNNFKPLPFDFTRASSATRVNKQGLVETVPSGKPRIDFLNNTSGHLLLEPSRTNIVPYSNDFNQHSITGGSITSDDIVSPDGSINADTFVEDTNSNYHFIREDISVLSGTYTMSVFVKGTSRFFSLYPQSAGVAYALFDIASETITKTGGANYVNSDIQNYGNGWYRCILTYTVSTGTSFLHIYLTNSSTSEAPIYTGNGSEMSFYGLQLEVGSYATSYIPTEGSSVTRVAENTTTQDNVPSTVIGQTEGTVYAEFKIYETPTGTQRIIILSDGTGNERIGIAVGSGILYAFIVDGGTTQCEIVKSSFTGGTHKVAFGYKANDFVLYLNGVQVGTDNSGSVSSCDRIDLGNQFNANQLEGNIIDTKLYNTRLTNTELQNLTS